MPSPHPHQIQIISVKLGCLPKGSTAGDHQLHVNLCCLTHLETYHVTQLSYSSVKRISLSPKHRLYHCGQSRPSLGSEPVDCISKLTGTSAEHKQGEKQGNRHLRREGALGSTEHTLEFKVNPQTLEYKEYGSQCLSHFWSPQTREFLTQQHSFPITSASHTKAF